MLLVEDNAINMEIAHAILGEEHLNITEAKNGKEALEIFQNSKSNEYDIIIMDMMMPVMDEHIGKPIDIPLLKRTIIKLLTKNHKNRIYKGKSDSSPHQ